MKVQIEKMSQEMEIPQERIRIALGVPETFNEARSFSSNQKYLDMQEMLRGFQVLIEKSSSFLEAVGAYNEINKTYCRGNEKCETAREKLLKKAICRIDLFELDHLKDSESLEQVMKIIEKCPSKAKT